MRQTTTDAETDKTGSEMILPAKIARKVRETFTKPTPSPARQSLVTAMDALEELRSQQRDAAERLAAAEQGAADLTSAEAGLRNFIFEEAVEGTSDETARVRMGAAVRDARERASDLGDARASVEVLDLVSEWQEQLKQISDLQENWYADQQALAAGFWSGVVDEHKGSAKDQQAAEDSLHEALKALDDENVTSAVQAAEKKAAAAKGNVAEVERIYSDLEATLIAYHADGGKKWDEVEEAKTAAVRKATDEMQEARIRQLAQQGKGQVADDESKGKTADIGLSTQGDQVKANASAGLISARQEASEMEAINQQIYENDAATQAKVTADKVANLDQQWDAASGNAQKQMALQQQITDAQKEGEDKQAQLSEQNAKRQADAQIQAAEKVQAAWRQNIAGTVSSFTSGIANMAEHGASLQSVMVSVGQGIQTDFLNSIDKMVTSWIMQMIFGAAQSQVTAGLQADASITASAATGAAAVFASLVGDPLTAPAAPGAAAATFAEIMAYTTIASAAGGFDIPTGINPVTQLHQEEMVLPASISNGLRSMIAGGSGSGGGSGGASNAGTHARLDALLASQNETNGTLKALHRLGKSAI